VPARKRPIGAGSSAALFETAHAVLAFLWTLF